MQNSLKVSVIGLGFVGLTTAVGLAHKGHKVTGIEIDAEKEKLIASGQLPFYEVGLEKALKQSLSDHSLTVVQQITAESIGSDVIIICVGTPSLASGATDLSYIEKAIREILAAIADNQTATICIKSTVPPPTTANVFKPLLNALSSNQNITMSNNPEFLREGNAWQDFMQPDRVVIGSEDEPTTELLKKMYAPFTDDIFHVSLNEAEYIKYLSNTLLATLISFANEQAMFADTIGNIDIAKAFQLLHQDKRWFGEPASMQSYVYPGCGYGGFCLPKDTQAFIAQAQQFNLSSPILQAVNLQNNIISEYWANKIIQECSSDQKIACLGLAFKPNSSDVRFSPSAKILQKLSEHFSDIKVYDPMANVEFKHEFPSLNISYCQSVQECINNTEVVLVATAWQEFLDNKKHLTDKKVYDLRYCLS